MKAVRAVFAIAVLAGLEPAAYAADADAGRARAEQWCASCHTVGRGAARGTDVAPAFSTLAHRPNFSADALRGWLSDPHPPMPNPNLTRQEIEDLVAYFQSLRP